jgi:hypothetical protein
VDNSEKPYVIRYRVNSHPRIKNWPVPNAYTFHSSYETQAERDAAFATLTDLTKGGGFRRVQYTKWDPS